MLADMFGTLVMNATSYLSAYMLRTSAAQDDGHLPGVRLQTPTGDNYISPSAYEHRLR
jgi:hypothetical protein